MSPYIEQKNAFFRPSREPVSADRSSSPSPPVCKSPLWSKPVVAIRSTIGGTQIHLLCGQRRRLHTCRHHRSDIRDASGMAYRRKRALFAMPCGCDRRLQSATRRDLVIEACVRIISSCGDQSLGETPGPIPNPEAKAWHGDGTAPDRVWESSTPPHHTYRKPLGAHAPRGFRIPETLTTQTHTPPQKHPGLLALMRPTSGTIPGQPRRRGRRETARRVRDRGSPTPEPPYP